MSTTTTTSGQRSVTWSPTAVWVDRERLLVADAWNHSVWALEPDGTLRRLVGTGRAGDGPDGCAAPDVPMCSPRGVTSAPDGSVYVSDSGNDVVRRVLPDGTVRIVGHYRSPGALAAGPDGCVLVVDGRGLHRLHPDGVSEPVPIPILERPVAVAQSTTGIVYVADVGLDRVVRVSPTGAVSTVAGTADRIPALLDRTDGDGGPALRARLRRPTSVAPDAAGGLVVVEAGATRLRRILPDGTITTIAALDGHTLAAARGAGICLLTLTATRHVDLDGTPLDSLPVVVAA